MSVVVIGLGGIGRAFTSALLARKTAAAAAATATPRIGNIFGTTTRLGTTPPTDGITFIEQVDVTDEATLARAAETVAVRDVDGKGVGLLINCAGFLHGHGRMPEKSVREVDRDFMMHNFAVNAVGAALVAKHFGRLLVKGASPQQPSRLINISAKVGSISDNNLGGWMSHRAAKAAQNAITKTLAIELRKSSVIVCALYPGTVRTKFSEPFRPNPKVLMEPDVAVERMLAVIDGLRLEDTGSFLAYDGKTIPW